MIHSKLQEPTFKVQLVVFFLSCITEVRFYTTEIYHIPIQQNFNGSNTDGSFTTAVSNSFLSPLERDPIAADIIIFGIIKCEFLYYIDNDILCVLIRIASLWRF